MCHNIQVTLTERTLAVVGANFATVPASTERVTPMMGNGILSWFYFLFFFFFLLKRWSFRADRETAQVFSRSTGGTKHKETYFAFWPFQPAAEKPCVSKAGGYCKKVQSTAFCLGNKLISAVQFFLFLQLPLRHGMYR